MRQSIIGLILLSAVPGCVSVDAYPDDWGKIVDTPDACPLLTGSYKNSGVRSGNRNSSSYWVYDLSQFLFQGDVGLADRIDIEFDSDRVLRVRALYQGEIVGSTSSSEQESGLDCGGSAAEIRARRYTADDRGNPVVGHSSIVTTVAKTTDGALVVNRSDRGAGMTFLLFPTVWLQENWTRFPPYDAVKR